MGFFSQWSQWGIIRSRQDTIPDGFAAIKLSGLGLLSLQLFWSGRCGCFVFLFKGKTADPPFLREEGARENGISWKIRLWYFFASNLSWCSGIQCCSRGCQLAWQKFAGCHTAWIEHLRHTLVVFGTEGKNHVFWWEKIILGTKDLRMRTSIRMKTTMHLESQGWTKTCVLGSGYSPLSFWSKGGNKSCVFQKKWQVYLEV